MTEPLDAGYDKLKGSQLVIIYCLESGATEGLYISRGATNIKVSSKTIRYENMIRRARKQITVPVVFGAFTALLITCNGTPPTIRKESFGPMS
jgi:hypothetical protein